LSYRFAIQPSAIRAPTQAAEGTRPWDLSESPWRPQTNSRLPSVLRAGKNLRNDHKRIVDLFPGVTQCLSEHLRASAAIRNETLLYGRHVMFHLYCYCNNKTSFGRCHTFLLAGVFEICYESWPSVFPHCNVLARLLFKPPGVPRHPSPRGAPNLEENVDPDSRIRGFFNKKTLSALKLNIWGKNAWLSNASLCQDADLSEVMLQTPHSGCFFEIRFLEIIGK